MIQRSQKNYYSLACNDYRTIIRFSNHKMIISMDTAFNKLRINNKIKRYHSLETCAQDHRDHLTKPKETFTTQVCSVV